MDKTFYRNEILIGIVLILFLLLLIFICKYKREWCIISPSDNSDKKLPLLLEKFSLLDTCSKLDKKDCLKKENCGWCKNGSIEKCVPGNEYGTFYNRNCDLFFHRDDELKQIVANKYYFIPQAKTRKVKKKKNNSFIKLKNNLGNYSRNTIGNYPFISKNGENNNNMLNLPLGKYEEALSLNNKCNCINNNM